MTSECDYSEIARMPWRARSGYQFCTPLLTPFDHQQNSDSYHTRERILWEREYMCTYVYYIWNSYEDIDVGTIGTVRIYIYYTIKSIVFAHVRESPIIPILFDSSIKLHCAVDILWAIIVSTVNQFPWRSRQRRWHWPNGIRKSLLANALNTSKNCEIT